MVPQSIIVTQYADRAQQAPFSSSITVTQCADRTKQAPFDYAGR
jgi:hypothetical protein